jgi:RNA polymerase sigma factor (sigma-70 family)
MPMPSTSDVSGSNATALDAVRRGDSAAFTDVVRRYERTLRAAVAAYRLVPAESADAVQNTWLRLVENSASIRDAEKLGGWLTTTARRECLALVRNRRFECACTVEIGQVRSLEPTPEEAVIRSEVRRRVSSATDTLSGRPRVVIDALFSECPGGYAEVARDTGIPIGSIGPTRIRALGNLRRSLSDLWP